MSDLAKYLLSQAFVELRKGNVDEAEALCKRARRHDKTGLTPGKQMQMFKLTLMIEDPDWLYRVYLR